ncbi:MAG: KDO2-lipid IV(A) lauroyltransferase [Ascidiaceihabitans sp.]|jgi:KDO2-lipid IV(A) lauroyltransferase
MTTTSENQDPWTTRTVHYLSNAVLYGMIKMALALPYSTRVPLMGAVVSRFIGPVVGYRKRAMKHLAHIYPEMPQKERKAIATACLNNTGRTMIENYSGREMLARMKDNPLTGAGVAVIAAAKAEGRPVILVSGHFGNFEAARAALVGRGYDIGCLYRNMSNPFFNQHYVRNMQDLGGPAFPQGRRGTAGFVRHLKTGGQLAMLFDLHVFGAPVLDFVGQPARTAVSAAELALRLNAELIPFYGIRQPDGLGFETVLEEPIAHSDPLTMTQALNDNLSEHIKKTPEQWFWVHRRWRPNSQ